MTIHVKGGGNEVMLPRRNTKTNLRELQLECFRARFDFEVCVTRFSIEKEALYSDSAFDNDANANFLRRNELEVVKLESLIAEMEAGWALFDAAVEESDLDARELIAIILAAKKPL